MKVEIETAETTHYEVVELDLDGSPIFDDHPRTVEIVDYYDCDGELLSQTVDNTFAGYQVDASGPCI